MVKKEDVLNALKNVLDPEIGIDIVNLGLVYDVRVKDDFVDVELTLTSPGCPVAPQILADAESKVKKIKGITKVKVEFVFDPPWTPDKMSDEARMLLGI
ncbi:MAG: metal-sulfur cluster assembly factor [Nanoarchaeota archaeon]|nr:metal-sulfur cluster assembly factor [Nanoarchaeota archaeon]MBU1270505.1 metal-sulfur cluster assembly factor [Nanoarchaeota archaeon]MBU1603905.1 metal-sulfur cluster assembly factor [Nanoarchaeota archaeon]MBU2442657.1 metal-sulfur cluster assembly factor [Nanoarchaeota archaeon]